MLLIMLSNETGRPVLDRTSLKGEYDFKLEWNPDVAQGFPSIGGRPADTTPAVSGPSIFAALQEQLGLRLEPQKGRVEICVIDRAEKPSEN